MSLLHHPKIWIFNAVLIPLNTATLTLCVVNNNVAGMIVNGFFLLINAIAAAGNFAIRHHRAKMQEDMKAEQRRELIRLTIGE